MLIVKLAVFVLLANLLKDVTGYDLIETFPMAAVGFSVFYYAIT